jgi:elongation factor G
MSKKNSASLSNLNAIRNVGIIAHIDAGKTTTTERFLYYSGKTHRIGEVDSGSTVMDYLDEERERGITIVAAAASFPWKHNNTSGMIHIIDTPGHIDFTAEVERSLRVIDGAVVLFSAVEGVEAQSEKVWHQSDRYKVPKLAFINKLDRLGASFSRVYNEIVDKFTEVKVCAVQLPVGEGADLNGIIDLCEMQYLTFSGDDGSEIIKNDIPPEYQESANIAREELISAVSEFSDEIAELYLEEKEISYDLLICELRRVVLANKLVPVFAGSAKKNIGIQPLLNAVIDLLPSPEDRALYPGINPKTGEEIEVNIHDSDFCGIIFKIIAGESADLLYMRTYSGKLHISDTLFNPRTREKVRIKRLLRLYSKNIEAVDEVGAGDIVGLIGPSNVISGDTLCAVNHQVLLEEISFPEPIISMAIEPKSTNERERLDNALDLICREDPTLDLRIHDATGQRLLSGMGELHLEINCHRIRDEFKVNARFGMPQVAFRETLKTAAHITGVFEKTMGDQELYAEVELLLEPVSKLESGIAVTHSISGNCPKNWIETASATLYDALKTGGNWGYPLIYIKGEIKTIKGDPAKTNEGAVAGAVHNALNKALATGTDLLEPLVKLDIMAPENSVGEITGYLQARRALIHGIENVAAVKHLSCEVPLAEMFGFSKALPKLSGGRAAFSMEPCGYQKISEADLEKLANRNTSIMN